MEREMFIQKVTDHLHHTYQCHTIILYGSYQNGDYTNESDVDLIGFSEVAEAENRVETFQGKLLDVWIHPTEEMNKPEQFLKVLEGEILLDEKQQAETFLEKIDAIYQAGPRKLAGKEKQFLKDWLIKMKVRSRKGDMEGRYRFYWLIKESLEIYFEMNGRWYLGPKKSLNWLAKHDPEGYRKYDKLLEGPGDRRRLDAWIDHLQKL
ncbi:Nucleotidyltransferase domain-containing protein [Halobacillus dabanensis]|uniref:Nucleotidyltransferase domain-containing protein n=1 Tax=Halobacillus dabanensis TaxID=240302 RepID=A0A1I3TL05_HALDA|nr:nucleotidyltransferase domain-containing protein [Halobacillus dabanensis]SFJ70301.1 Nucleotidyltransferase domain-containing protein [Halobacillus dabanensis]